MMNFLRKIIQDPRTERFIMGLIALWNSAHHHRPPHIGVFVLEILARFLVQRGAFFREGWKHLRRGRGEHCACTGDLRFLRAPRAPRVAATEADHGGPPPCSAWLED